MQPGAVGQVLHVHIGQAGCQLGHAVWELLCLEHGVQPDGQLVRGLEEDASRSSAFAAGAGGGRATPRAILCDTEPTVVDEIRSGAYRGLFGAGSLVSGAEGAAGSYAVGYRTVGRLLLPSAMDRLRRMAEDCERPEGCLLYHSLGGGTGSAFTTLLMEAAVEEMPKMRMVQVAVYPSPRLATGTVEPYNTGLALQAQDELTSGTLVLDNESMYDILSRRFGSRLGGGDYSLANRLTAQVVSSLTAGARFGGQPAARLDDISTNLIPYPKLHLLVPSYAPLLREGAERRTTAEAGEGLVDEALSDGNAFAKVEAAGKRALASCFLFRGDVSPCDGNAWLQKRKALGRLRFQSWLPTGVKVAYCDEPPTRVPGSGVGVGSRALAVVSNTPAVARKFSNLGRKFGEMFSRGSHLVTFVENGFTMQDFEAAREYLAARELEYLETADCPEGYEEAARDDAREDRWRTRRVPSFDSWRRS